MQLTGRATRRCESKRLFPDNYYHQSEFIVFIPQLTNIETSGKGD